MLIETFNYTESDHSLNQFALTRSLARFIMHYFDPELEVQRFSLSLWDSHASLSILIFHDRLYLVVNHKKHSRYLFLDGCWSRSSKYKEKMKVERSFSKTIINVITWNSTMNVSDVEDWECLKTKVVGGKDSLATVSTILDVFSVAISINKAHIWIAIKHLTRNTW